MEIVIKFVIFSATVLKKTIVWNCEPIFHIWILLKAEERVPSLEKVEDSIVEQVRMHYKPGKGVCNSCNNSCVHYALPVAAW